MVTERPTTPQSTKSAAAADSSDLASTQAGETSNVVEANADPSKAVDDQQKLSKARVAVLLISVFLCMFLVALDRTIISTVWVHFTEQSLRSDGFSYCTTNSCVDLF